MRCEAAQDQFGDALGELLVDRAACDEKPIEERPAEHVEDELEIEIGTQVATLDAPPKHLAQRRPPAGQEPAANRARQLRLLGHCADQVRHQQPRERPAVELDRLPHQGEQISVG